MWVYGSEMWTLTASASGWVPLGSSGWTEIDLRLEEQAVVEKRSVILSHNVMATPTLLPRVIQHPHPDFAVGG